MINLGRTQRFFSFIIGVFLPLCWNGSILSYKRFLFSFLDSIQDTSTVVFVLENTKI